MTINTDKLFQSGCDVEDKHKVCRSRGGESCAFDGAMIVLQPIADAAHIVHGPIACCGNSWEGRGSLSSKGSLHRMGFTTDMSEMDIVHGSHEKLYKAILETCQAVNPKAIFVHATCVSGLTGEDLESVCTGAAKRLAIPVIPVNAPGFVGPKNLGNRIAGEVLLDHVIGTGEPDHSTAYDINLIGEYNIAGDLWLVEPVLAKSGVRILSRITGDATFEEITYAHRAKLNVVVCSRALINVAKQMEKRYGIPYVEVSFFGKTEMSNALRLIGATLKVEGPRLEEVIAREESLLESRLKEHSSLRGKKAVLYSGGVKSWSFISALLDLGIEVAAVGTKKSTVEDEEKMRRILGENAPLVGDTTPKNLLRLMNDNNADILVAGGRNQYLAIKEGFPFVDVNQERHTSYAGYEGLVNLAEQITNGIRFYETHLTSSILRGEGEGSGRHCSMRYEAQLNPDFPPAEKESGLLHSARDDNRRKHVLIDPLKHSQSIGAAIAFQGVHRALPVIHGAQGCNFLAKVLLTKHFRDPVALVSTKLFTEDVVMGSEGNITGIVEDIIEKSKPDVIGVVTTGLSEIKGDDTSAAVKELNIKHGAGSIVHVSTPDYKGGLETGYAKAVQALLGLIGPVETDAGRLRDPGTGKRINILAGSHLTPADFTELKAIVESFGMIPIILPDLSALDGSRQGFSSLATGGTSIDQIKTMGDSEFTFAVGPSMEPPAKYLKERSGMEYKMFESIGGLTDTDIFLETLSMLSGVPVPSYLERQRRVLIDGMRDAHFYYGNKSVCLALETDPAIQTSRWLKEMGAILKLAVLPSDTPAADRVLAERIVVGDLHSIEGEFDLMISNSHAEDAARRLGIPLYQSGFPVFKVLGNTSEITIGYRGTLALVNALGNLLAKEVHI
jgi:nitrogenase molybdenum-cofactor synthesis protein NifE